MKDIRQILLERTSNVDWTKRITDIVTQGLENWRWASKNSSLGEWEGEGVDIKSVKKSGKGWIIKVDLYEKPYEVVVKKL